MKRVLLLFLVFSLSQTVSAQKESKIGLKGGFNYNIASASLEDAGDALKDPKTNNGWHLGINYRAYMGSMFYWQPELIYSQTSSSVQSKDSNDEWINNDFDNQWLDLNILVGVELLDFVRVYAGPTGIFHIGSDQGNDDVKASFNSFRAGFQIGAGVDLFNFLTADLAYKGSFSSDNGIVAVAGQDIPVTSNVSQLQISVGLMF